MVNLSMWQLANLLMLKLINKNRKNEKYNFRNDGAVCITFRASTTTKE